MYRMDPIFLKLILGAVLQDAKSGKLNDIMKKQSTVNIVSPADLVDLGKDLMDKLKNDKSSEVSKLTELVNNINALAEKT
jgi:hypothetical protein